MTESYEYQVSIDPKKGLHELLIDEFPSLKVYLLSSENNLCSKLKGVMCFWEGDLVARVEVNGTIFLINDHDKKNGVVNDIISDGDIYRFQGIAPTGGEQGKKTYLIFTIEKISKKQKSQSYHLKEIFTIKLGENASTGYHWEFETTPGLEILESQYTSDCKPGVAGCGGKRTLVLRGTKKGTQTLTMYNIPPGRGSSPDVETMVFMIA